MAKGQCPDGVFGAIIAIRNAALFAVGLVLGYVMVTLLCAIPVGLLMLLLGADGDLVNAECFKVSAVLACFSLRALAAKAEACLNDFKL